MQTLMRPSLALVLALSFAACGGGKSGGKTPTTPPVDCGNGSVDADKGEECDGTKFNGMTCANKGYTSGELKCTAACKIDTTGCTNTAVCGDGSIEPGEKCDGANLDNKTCETVGGGFAAGTLKCKNDCSDFDTSGCTTASCGNDRQEGSEECDGTDLDGQTCARLGMGGGTLMCDSLCKFDVSECTNLPAQCGNNIVEGTEKCDGTDLAGKTCQTMGFTSGTLRCKAASNCADFDTTSCTGTPTACTGPDTYRQASPALNVNLADGEPCNFSSDCTSGTCNSSYYCGDELVTPTIHDGDLPLGRACDVDGACLSGYCWTGGDSYVCAETCGAPITATGPGLACQADDYSPTAASCFPGPGPGQVGATCVSGAFDCATSQCFNEEFCTAVCDPTVTTAGAPDGCPAAATCSYLGSDPLYGDIFICVANTRPRQNEGGTCELPFDCSDPLACVDGKCRKPCPLGTECTTGFYCATDNPAGPICLPESSRKGVGEACAYTSECQASLVCFNEGTGLKCHSTCPAGTCTGGLNCVQAETGPALDTVVTLYKVATPTTVWGEDDDSGTGYFSLLSKALDEANPQFFLKVTRYAGSEAGPYDLTVAMNSTVPAGSINEIDANSSDNAQLLTLPARVKASFVDQGTTADVDWFKFTATGTAADTLKVTTSPATSGVCISGTTLAADGAACTGQGICQHDCFPFIRVGTQSFCAKPCNTNGDCGTGACQQFADINPTQGYCFPAGTVGLGNRTFGQSCVGPHDCASRTCLKHKFGAGYQCGDVCTTADTACAGSGMCSATDPIYGKACVPTLNPRAAPGASCVWDADCQDGNVCVAEVCQPQTTLSRYNPPTGVRGASCNLDSDCQSPLACVNFYCNDGTVTGCVGGAPNGSLQAGELCDGTLLAGATCSNIGAGTGTLACNSTCDGYDLSSCAGFPNGHACNYATDCHFDSVCFGDGNTWYCAYDCGTNPADVGCAGSMFTPGLAVSCQPDPGYAGYYVCLPSPGVGGPADPCRSSYLDCKSNWCWENTFCVAECSSATPNCGRNATCATYDARTTDTTRLVDTRVTIADATGTALASNDNVTVGDNPAASYYGAIDYYNDSAAAQTVYVSVAATSASTTPLAKAGDYQLQLFGYEMAPPFGAPILESELRTPAVLNDSRATAQDMTGVGLPVRIDANLSTAADVDFFKVTLQPYEWFVAQTTFPIGQVCWPTAEINKPVNAECSLDFECATGKCLGYCATECTSWNVDCNSGFSCDAFLGDYRFFCFDSKKFNADCSSSAVGPLYDAPSCPNDLCLTRDSGTSYWCSDVCSEIGAGCGDYTTGYNGECTTYDDRGGVFGLEAICVPTLGGTVAINGNCALDADCVHSSGAPTCCNQTTGKCVADPDSSPYGAIPCNYMGCRANADCDWLQTYSDFTNDCCDQTTLLCIDSTTNCLPN
jgi:hypothetical protein